MKVYRILNLFDNIRMDKLRILFRTFLEKYPILGNAVVYGTLCIAAETSQQTINNKILASPAKPLDTKLIGQYAVYGIGVGGPVVAIWYRFLDKKLPGTAVKTIVKKMMADQFVFTPQLLVLFYMTMSILERKSDVTEELRKKFVDTYIANCMFWIPVQSINFSLIPSVYRVTYIGMSSFAWINILCWFKRQKIVSSES